MFATCDGLDLTMVLALSPTTVARGQQVVGTATISNPTGADIQLKAADIAARPPGGTHSGGPFLDLYDQGPTTVPAGQSVVITGGRTLTSSDPLGSWYAYLTLEDPSGGYHDCGADIDFTVTAGGSSATNGSAASSTATSTASSSRGATASAGSSGSGSSGTSAGGSTIGSASGSTGTAPSGLHVVLGATGSPGHLEDGENQVVLLHGADRSGTEFACTYEAGGDPDAGFPGFFDGPNDQTGLDAMVAWHINAVRVPLNEDCWLGINGLPTNDTAEHYQSAIQSWVNLINQDGMVAILDLHWAAPGSEVTNGNIGQLPMADADHAPAFWSSVASTFAANSSVIFDLFNEPYITDWGCWLDGAASNGGTCALDKNNAAYPVAGMANLLQSVRNAGANNVVILGGLGYSSDFSQWASSVNQIPDLAAPLSGLSLTNVAASWHSYDFNSQNSDCPSQYTAYLGLCTTGQGTASNAHVTDVLTAGFPVVMGESGISAYSSSSAQPFSSTELNELQGWYESLLSYMDSQNQGYLGWSWNLDTPPELISDYAGTPSPYFGVTYQNHLKGL